MSGYGREERGGREEGLAFNYLGFPRQEAIHLRVYAIFEGGREEGARLPTDVTGQGGKFARNITTIYTPSR